MYHPLIALGLWTNKKNKNSGKMSFCRLRFVANAMLYSELRTLTLTL